MESKPSIYLNPKFKNAHINPNFLHQSNKILINPRFLQQKSCFVNSNYAVAASRPPEVVSKSIAQPPIVNGIIRNTRRTLVRASTSSASDNSTASKLPAYSTEPNTKKLIKLSKNKLVTATHLMKVQQKENEIIRNKNELIIRTKKLKRKEKEPKSVYKLDRRNNSPVAGSKKKKIVKKYSIKRVEQVSPKKEIVRKSCRTSLINLQNMQLAKTYKTNRSHLSTIKTKSISMLNKFTTKKSNIICPIFRRLGKCSGFNKGRCHKLHEKKYVNVCRDYIKGSCKSQTCLFSHDTSLRKMPVCKYFLQGLCQKQKECLYLHKKLSDDTKLCSEFIKGFCPLGEKCKLLHDFPGSSMTEKNVKTNYKRKIGKESQIQIQFTELPSVDVGTNNRYFANDDENETSEQKIPIRRRIETLPAYIPL